MRTSTTRRSAQTGGAPKAPKASNQVSGQQRQRRASSQPSSRMSSSRPAARRSMSQRERRKEACRRALSALEQGTALGPCVLVTLVATRQRRDGSVGRDYHVEPTLRSEVWHLLWTRITQEWPEAQAFTVLEWGKRSGVYLHAVVRGAPGLTRVWMRQMLARRFPTIDIHLQEVTDGDGIAEYLTKSLANGDAWRNWGSYAHPTSQSRRWLSSSPGDGG